MWGYDGHRPDVLTPSDFETWARVLIKAYPSTEYKRLQKALEVFQIRDKRGLPITINRSLFPELSDPRIREDLRRSIVDNAPTAHNYSYPIDDLLPNRPSAAK